LATHTSAIKRMRQNKKRMMRNRHIKSTMKTHIKDFLLSLEQKNPDDSKTKLKEAINRQGSIQGRHTQEERIEEDLPSHKKAKFSRSILEAFQGDSQLVTTVMTKTCESLNLRPGLKSRP